MAVSMSAGGSGYMRSDYMISDAAIPLRVEESMEQAENSGQFSKVLSGIGEAKKAVRTEVSGDKAAVTKGIPTDAAKDVPQDFHQLAEAVANGEIKLEDIPKELLSENMLKELTKLVEAAESPEIKQELPDISKDPAAQELLAELSAMLSSQQTVVIPDDKTEELSALTVQPEVEAVQPVEVQQTAQVIPEQTQPVIQQEAVQSAEVVKTAETAPEFIAPQEKQAASVETEKPVKQEKPVQAVSEQPVAEKVEISVVQQTSGKSGENAEQQSENPAENGFVFKAEAPKEQNETQPVEFSRIREDISHAEVKTTKKSPETEQTEQAAEQEPVFTQHTAQRSRVVSKSDELQMIKDSAKPADENANNANAAQTMLQPQTTTAEKPVIFTKADGAEVPVKPSEVAQQVADKLTERTEELPEGDVEYSVTLNPEELGRITVRMTKNADGAVSVSIAAENSRTLRIIEDNGSAIQDTLKQNGIQLESWQTVSESKQETHAEDYQGSSKNPYRESENSRQEQDSDDESFAEIIASM